MKRLILLSAVMALALLPVLQAGDNKANDKPGCCPATKSDCGKCPSQGGSCPASVKSSKDSTKAAKQQAKVDKKAAQVEKKAPKKAPQPN